MFSVTSGKILTDLAKETKKSVKVCIWFTIPIDIATAIICSFTPEQFAANVIGDIVKALIAAGSGVVAAAVMIFFGVPTAVAFIIGIPLALAAGSFMDAIDERYGLTQKALSRLEGYEVELAPYVNSAYNTAADAFDSLKESGDRLAQETIYTTDRIWSSLKEMAGDL